MFLTLPSHLSDPLSPSTPPSRSPLPPPPLPPPPFRVPPPVSAPLCRLPTACRGLPQCHAGDAARFRMEEKLRVRMVGWGRCDGGGGGGDDVDDPLALTLGSIYASVPTPPSSPPPPPGPHSSQERSPRHRLNSPAAPLFAPAQHDTLEHLLLKGITSVEGVVRCKRCFGEEVIAYDLEAKFHEVRNYVAANRLTMNDRAPEAWMCPRLPDCVACGWEGCMSPVIPSDKREINWMFLFLGQMLGCCTLEDLKYFCKHTKQHRTGAKNRVLYYAFLEMCRQLEPQGPFN